MIVICTGIIFIREFMILFQFNEPFFLKTRILFNIRKILRNIIYISLTTPLCP